MEYTLIRLRGMPKNKAKLVRFYLQNPDGTEEDLWIGKVEETSEFDFMSSDVVIDEFQKALQEENYERCAKIRDYAKAKGIDLRQ